MIKAQQFLSNLPFFLGLPEEDMSAFFKSSQVKEYKKQEAVFQQGDKAESFFVVKSGWIKLCRTTPEGEEAIISLFTRGDVFGEAAIFSGADYPFNAIAAENAKVIVIPGSILRERAERNHEIMGRIMSSMSREMRNLQIENEHMALMSAPQRVGCLLLQLSSNISGEGGTLTFPYDKSLAAARLGMKPETFSRALVQLKPLGVVVKGSDIKIESFSQLIAYCCGHCSSLPGECLGQRENCDNPNACCAIKRNVIF